jgi:transketolase
VAEIVCEKQPVPVRRIGLRDTFGKTGPAGELMKYFNLTADALEQAAKEILHFA